MNGGPAKPGDDPIQNMQARHHVLGQPVTGDVALLGNGAPSNLPVAPVELPVRSSADGSAIINLL